MPKQRRFLVLDLLTLTTATALGIVGTRKVWKWWAYAWFWNLDRAWSAGATLDRLNTAMAILTPVLAAWTAPVLASRFVPPRPRLRRVALQPGSAACGAALLVIAAETVAQAASLAVFEASIRLPRPDVEHRRRVRLVVSLRRPAHGRFSDQLRGDRELVRPLAEPARSP